MTGSDQPESQPWDGPASMWLISLGFGNGRRLARASDMLNDIRHALRLLGRSSGFTALCLATLALGIGTPGSAASSPKRKTVAPTASPRDRPAHGPWAPIADASCATSWAAGSGWWPPES